jgi:hypothetical protein
MKCLSVGQPFATLLCLGIKRYETRSWRTDFRGTLAIHASRVFQPAFRALCAKEPFRSLLAASGHDLPRGGLIGTATLIDCLPTERILPQLTDREFLLGDYRAGHWAWEMADPRLFKHPIPARGKLGLFEIDLQ